MGKEEMAKQNAADVFVSAVSGTSCQRRLCSASERLVLTIIFSLLLLLLFNQRPWSLPPRCRDELESPC